MNLHGWGMFRGGLGIVIVAMAVLAGRPGGAGPEDTNRPNCGFGDDLIPDFTLTDVNPTSATHDQAITLSDLQGKIVFFMFVHSSCGVCKTNAGYLQAMLDEHAADWGDDVVFMTINMVGWDSQIDEYCALSNLTVLQDTQAVNVEDEIGSSIYWSYLVDPDRRLATFYYDTYIPSDGARLEAEIEQLLEAKRGK